MECDQIQKMRPCSKSNQVVLSYAILSCWPHSTAPLGSCLLKLNPDCIMKWSWLHPEQQFFYVYKQQMTVQYVKFWLRAMCTRREQLCSATAQIVKRNTFSHWCMLVKPSATSNIPLRLTKFPQFPKFSSHLFYFAPLCLGNFILLNTFIWLCRVIAHLHNWLQDTKNQNTIKYISLNISMKYDYYLKYSNKQGAEHSFMLSPYQKSRFWFNVTG